jgi:hypothetical protein
VGRDDQTTGPGPGRRRRLQPRAFANIGRRSFGKVIEYQARGAIHYHAVIRLDGIDPEYPDAITTPGCWADLDTLSRAITAAASRATVTAPDGRVIRWGRQLDIEPIEATTDGLTGYVTKASWRIASYATKAAETAGTVDRPITCADCRGHGDVDGTDPHASRTIGAAFRLPVSHARRQCQRCGGSGLRCAIDALDVTDHARRLIHACWTLGADPLYQSLGLRRWAHQLGYGGHFSTKSRRYSTTLTALRNARREYSTGYTLERLRLDRTTPTVRVASTEARPITGVAGVIVVGAWRYAGRGHSPGGRCWANSVATGIAHSKRIVREIRSEQSSFAGQKVA